MVVFIDGLSEVLVLLLQVVDLVFEGSYRDILLAVFAYRRLKLKELSIQLSNDIVLALQLVIHRACKILLEAEGRLRLQLLIFSFELFEVG